VLVSPSLATLLTPEQLASLLCHELAHLVRWHPVRRAALLVGLVVVSGGWIMAEPLGTRPLTKLAWVIFVTAVFSAWGIGCFCWHSRQLELEADELGCRLLSRMGRPDLAETGGPMAARSPVAAAEVYTGALERLTGNRPTGWLHPSLDRRQRFLAETAGWPRLADRHRWSVVLGEVAIAMALAAVASLTPA
jgi:Zn-dependent protease with chaperone function